jgi:urease gamma subunit
VLSDIHEAIAKISDDLIEDGHNYQMVAEVLVKGAMRLIENEAPSVQAQLAGYEELRAVLDDGSE